MLPITIWLNIPSPHQTDVLRELALDPRVDLQVIFARKMPDMRIEQGWEASLAGYPHYFLNARFPYLDALKLAGKPRNRFHIVGGIWADPFLTTALLMLTLLRGQYAILTEAPDNLDTRHSPLVSGVKAALGAGVLRRRGTFLLAISHLSRDYFRRFGIDNSRIYEYGYFRSSHDHVRLEHSLGQHVLYAGQLVPRKRVEMLLEAAIPLFASNPELKLTFIGDGVERQKLELITCQHGLIDRVCFKGTISSNQVPSRIAEADVFVLPSRHDGWGVGVNEALSVGVPVIVSDACGSADLIQHGVNGYIFKAGSVDELRNCLKHFLGLSEAERLLMRQAAADTGRRISADVVAPYLIACLQHMQGLIAEKPLPPWKTKN